MKLHHHGTTYTITTKPELDRTRPECAYYTAEATANGKPYLIAWEAIRNKSGKLTMPDIDAPYAIEKL